MQRMSDDAAEDSGWSEGSGADRRQQPQSSPQGAPPAGYPPQPAYPPPNTGAPGAYPAWPGTSSQYPYPGGADAGTYWGQPAQQGPQDPPSYPPYAPDGRVDPQLMRQTEPGKASGRNRTGTAVGVGATLLAVLSKVGVLAKLALPLLSAVASFWLYALRFGWQFGLGIVVLLFVHEMGHVIVIRAKGLPASLPIFIPFLGALIMMRSMPHDARDEAEIAVAGPIAGTIAGIACYAVYVQTDSHLWLALAFFSFVINLFNLLPVSPLDGGRIAGAISKWIWPLGLVLVGIAVVYTHSVILLIIGAMGLFRTLDRFRGGKALDAYYAMPIVSRVGITVLYFGLAAFLGVVTYQTQHLLVAGGGSLFR
jgi:Zn-dependent protease